jgi:hypothetical protein
MVGFVFWKRAILPTQLTAEPQNIEQGMSKSEVWHDSALYFKFRHSLFDIRYSTESAVGLAAFDYSASEAAASTSVLTMHPVEPPSRCDELLEANDGPAMSR